MKNTLCEINRMAQDEPELLIKEAEEQYLNEIYSLADLISADDDLKIISIAGPSASGKTTTAHILRDRLLELGEKTDVVSLDNFYLPTESLPVLEDGRQDIESVNALDIPLMEKCFGELISSGVSHLPEYDFQQKKRVTGKRKIDISHGGIVITEGLHALNPIITGLVPKKNIYKIYISVNSRITDSSGETLLSSRQLRLVRRSLRDEVFRNSSIGNTLSLWNGVIEGESRYLYSFKTTADLQLKTLHAYEPCIYRDRFIAMRDELDESSVCFDFFIKTARALEKFVSLDRSLVPKNSLIREFIGDGIYNA